MLLIIELGLVSLTLAARVLLMAQAVVLGVLEGEPGQPKTEYSRRLYLMGLRPPQAGESVLRSRE